MTGLRPVPAATLLGGLAAAAMLSRHAASAAAVAALLLAVCLRTEGRGRGVLVGASLLSALGVLVLSPPLASEGSTPIWTGPSLPVLGVVDVTSEELASAALQASRLAAVGLAFAAFALAVDHDRLVALAGPARRSALAVALATRLLPTLERDAAGLSDAVRGRGIEVGGVRGRARLLSPLVAGSLERATSLAEAMEARGYGARRPTRAPAPAWRWRDRAAVAAAAAAVVVGALWL